MATKRQYREAIRIAKGVYAEAAKLLGVSRQAVKQYVDNHPDLKEFAFSFQEIMLDNLEKHLADGVERGDLEMIKLAARYYGHKRGLIERKEFTGEDGAPLGLSEGTKIDASFALIMHSEEGQKLLDFINDLGIPRLENKRPQEDST